MNVLGQLPHLLGASPRDPEALRRMSDARVRSLIQHVWKHSPYYRDAMQRAGLTPADVRGAADLPKLPVLTKAIARERMREIVDSRADLAKHPPMRTSGTSGEALVLPTTPAELRMSHAIWFSAYMRCGASPWARQAKFVTSLAGRDKKWAFQRLGLFRRDYFLVTAPTREKIRWLRETKPDVVFGWGSILNHMAMTLEADGERLEIPLVISSSEYVLHDLVARHIGRRLMDLYGAIETANVAVPCPLGRGHHIDTRWNVIELLDENGRPAPSGRIAITVLWRRTMPLLRYEIGDMGTWATEPCGCGNAMPLLASLDGRIPDLFELRDGDKVGHGALVVAARKLPGTREYQFVQPARGEIICHVVAGPDFPADAAVQMAQTVEAMLQNRMSIWLHRVETLPRIPGEKQRAIVTMDHLARWRAAGHDIGEFLAR